MQNPGRWVVACEPCPGVQRCCPICCDTAWTSGQQRLGDTDMLCPEQELQVHHADLCHSDFLSPLLCPRQQGPCDSQGFQAKGPPRVSGIHRPSGAGCFSAHCPAQGPASSAWPPGQECEPPAHGTATHSPGDLSHGAGMAAGHVWPPDGVSVPAEQEPCWVISPGCERLWSVILQERR